MREFLIIFLLIVSIFWGIAHFEVAFDHIKSEESFWTTLGFGLCWVLFGGTGFVMWLASQFSEIF